MDTQSKHLAHEERRDCPRARPFRRPTDEELLLGRMERAVDEIVEALSALASTGSREAAASALPLTAAARRLVVLTSRWPSPPGS